MTLNRRDADHVFTGPDTVTVLTGDTEEDTLQPGCQSQQQGPPQGSAGFHPCVTLHPRAINWPAEDIKQG